MGSRKLKANCWLTFTFVLFRTSSPARLVEAWLETEDGAQPQHHRLCYSFVPVSTPLLCVNQKVQFGFVLESHPTIVTRGKMEIISLPHWAGCLWYTGLYFSQMDPVSPSSTVGSPLGACETAEPQFHEVAVRDPFKQTLTGVSEASPKTKTRLAFIS